ncbi:2-(1,2-epoxy-1,2-dihydrophenyl)acetyl-CoA isomerase [Rhodococcus sp. 27YEA15]|uniref:enoyl-CoA hydratase/isomerase family protein n=1 Tax=Rhodococcus sp. 27YEA15 TaxID=3156259 RepID=UPI003C7CA717
MTSFDDSSKVAVDEGVLRITISTAANGTSLDSAGLVQGVAALTSAGPEIGSVLLVGEGSNFCAGGNVREFAAAPDRSRLVGAVARSFHDFVRALDNASVPVVAGVHGWAAGAGMSLVCLADVAIGGPGTKLRPAYPSIGFTPDGGMSWTLPRIVGTGRASEILLNDSVIGGDEAVRLGILARLVGDDEVQEEAARLARSLANGPSSSHAGIKALLRGARTNSLSEQLDAEAASISVAADSPVGREGVDAFVEKRRPDWSAAKQQ